MISVLKTHRWLSLAFGVLVGAAATSAIALAAIPDSSGVINGCYQKNNGQLRVTDKACGPSEAALSWNQQGSQGQPGPPGEAGPQGAAGPQGEPGSLNVVHRETGMRVFNLAPGEVSGFVVTYCSSGEVAINGFPAGIWPNISVASSTVFWDGTHPSGWGMQFRNDAPYSQYLALRVQALCAKGTESAE